MKKKPTGYFGVKKGKKSPGKLGNHINREPHAPSSYDNADPSRLHLNYERTDFPRIKELKSKGINRLEDRVNFLIDEARQKNKKLREQEKKVFYAKNKNLGIKKKMRASDFKAKNFRLQDRSVTYLDALFGSGTCEAMRWIYRDKRRSKIFENRCYEFLSKEWGSQNIVSFVVHLDEETPHIHAIIVPITNDGRLSSKEVSKFTTENAIRRQDAFFKDVTEKMGFGRGKSKAYTQRKHLTSDEYKAEMRKLELEKQDVSEKINLLVLEEKERKDRIKQKEEDFKKLKSMIDEEVDDYRLYRKVKLKMSERRKTNKGRDDRL